MKHKINLKTFNGFALIIGDTSLEANRLSVFCLVNDIYLKRISKKNKCPKEYVPCGSVEWCENLLGYKVTPDYYPEWTKDFWHRKIWRNDEWILGQKLFVKPADRYKRFTGFKTHGTYSKKKKPPYIWSEIIQFDNEWRYYVSHGNILSSNWYEGDEMNIPTAPKLDISIPNDYCGAVDFGDYNGVLTLVEAQHPFACGWYGSQEDDHLYFQWLVDGWEYMLRGK